MSDLQSIDLPISNTTPTSNPFDMTMKMKIIIGIFVLVALGVGFYFLYKSLTKDSTSRKPEVFGILFPVFDMYYPGSISIDPTTGILSINNTNLTSDVLQKLMPAGYSIATTEQVMNANMAGMQQVNKWGVCSDKNGNLVGCCPKQVAYLSTDTSESIQVLYNPFQSIIISSPPTGLNIPNAVWVFGMKPDNYQLHLVSTIKNTNTYCAVTPWYEVFDNENSRASIWNQPNPSSSCNLSSDSQCMQPLGLGTKFVDVGNNTSGNTFTANAEGALTGCIYTGGFLMFQTNRPVNNYPVGSFVIMAPQNGSDATTNFKTVLYSIGFQNPNQFFTNTFANGKFQLQNGNVTLTKDSTWGLSVSSSGTVVMSQDQKQWQQIQFTPVSVAL